VTLLKYYLLQTLSEATQIKFSYKAVPTEILV